MIARKPWAEAKKPREGKIAAAKRGGGAFPFRDSLFFFVFFFSAFPFVLDQFFFSSIFIHSKIYFTLFSVISLETLEFLICRDVDQSFDEI